MPPTNIDASPCTVRIGEPGRYQRGPGVQVDPVALGQAVGPGDAQEELRAGAVAHGWRGCWHRLTASRPRRAPGAVRRARC